MGLTHDISIIKQQYRELFPVAHQELLEWFGQLLADYRCTQCDTTPESITSVLHSDCGYREWQKAAIVSLDKDMGKRILETLEEIKVTREIKGQCHGCGVCCSLASSEFSYEALQEKAKNGDYFAQQFTSVFLPYESHEAAREKFPELVSEIVEQTESQVHFYHCPYLNSENKCTLYNDPRRPQICADYPETPLILMYKNCGYQPWKAEMLPTTLHAHALLELCHFYVQQISEALATPGEALPLSQ